MRETARRPSLEMHAKDGPTPPTSGESNWVPTDPNGHFEVLARFYGPQKPLYEKTWKMPDVELCSWATATVTFLRRRLRRVFFL